MLKQRGYDLKYWTENLEIFFFLGFAQFDTSRSRGVTLAVERDDVHSKSQIPLQLETCACAWLHCSWELIWI
jgi:hypothetical protein